MFGFEIIKLLASILTGKELIVSSNGNISRQVYHYCPKHQIYLRGSMGLPISVGLGLSLAQPEKQILTILGDGNLLMGLGSLATVSFVQPSNLKILILDNNLYATTGNQETTSGNLNYPALLDGFGLSRVRLIAHNETVENAKEQLQAWLDSGELCILPALVNAYPPALDNIPLHPEEITALFKQVWESKDS